MEKVLRDDSVFLLFGSLYLDLIDMPVHQQYEQDRRQQQYRKTGDRKDEQVTITQLVITCVYSVAVTCSHVISINETASK